MITDRSKLEAVERELALRHQVYERRVRARQMKQSWADYQISIFEAIRDDYRAKVDAAEQAERLI